MKKNGVYLIYFIEFIQMAAFGAYLSTLSLFFLSEHIKPALSFSTVSIFLAGSALSSILCGGFISKWVSMTSAIALGFLFYGLALLILVSDIFNIQLIALSLMMLASGLFVPSINVLLNHQFIDNTKRHRAAQVNYIFMNLGAITGYLIAGLLVDVHFRYVHIFGGCICLIGLFIFLRYKNILIENSNTTNWYKLMPTLLALAILYSFILKHQAFTKVILITLGLASFAYIYHLYKKEKRQEYLTYLFYIAMVAIAFHMVNTIYYVLYGVFIKYNVDTTLPPTFFMILNPVAVVVIGCCMSGLYKRKPITVYNKLRIGIIILGIGVLALVIGLKMANTQNVHIIWPILSITLLAFAEFLIMPTTYVETTHLTPTKRHSVFMGFTRGYRGFAIALSSLLINHAALSDKAQKLATQTNGLYLDIFVLLCFAAALTFLTMIVIKRLGWVAIK